MEGDYIKDLAYKIKTNGWIEAVVVGETNSGYELWEGQHRTRALRVLGFSTVPAYIIKINEE
jgi:ParB family chromosome partitioning protein